MPSSKMTPERSRGTMCAPRLEPGCGTMTTRDVIVTSTSSSGPCRGAFSRGVRTRLVAFAAPVLFVVVACGGGGGTPATPGATGTGVQPSATEMATATASPVVETRPPTTSATSAHVTPAATSITQLAPELPPTDTPEREVTNAQLETAVEAVVPGAGSSSNVRSCEKGDPSSGVSMEESRFVSCKALLIILLRYQLQGNPNARQAAIDVYEYAVGKYGFAPGRKAELDADLAGL